MVYTSLENKKIKDLKKLNTKKFRKSTNTFLIEGEHLVTEAYKQGILKELIVSEEVDFKLDIKTSVMSNNVLKYISEMESFPKVMGVCNLIEENIQYDSNVLILDNIQDPGNLGTIIRSAVAFNIKNIILSNGCVDIYNSKVLRATQGMIFKINFIYSDLENSINNLKVNNYQILGTKVDGGISIKKYSNNNKLALIMGNEGSGVRNNILNMCDDYIYVDMFEECESLNVAVATSIIMYELDRK